MSGFNERFGIIKAAVKQAETDANNLLVDEIKRLFDRHPEINFISWAQYIPISDGDVCELSVSDIQLSNYENVSNGEWLGDEEEPDDLNVVEVGRYRRLPEGYKDCQQLVTFLTDPFGRQMLESKYDYNIELIFSRDGITTRTYDPD